MQSGTIVGPAGKGMIIVPILLTLSCLSTIPLPSEALLVFMDVDLGNSDVSFWGEDSGDISGYSVAGAGDVNGDGDDDILIGAYMDDDGGTDAGQTYLILGKATGWAMDTDLSNANASFWGEDADDWSGWSVAGAGDVNGDGYDDILIGAFGDDDGGTDAGQTYLILGKASGWGMDTDLSSADASFWGEDADDCSGCSVAGAGDVNGDGYDDILIGAYGDDDGGSGAGQTYLILGKASGWTMDTDLSNADASFWGEDAGDWSGHSVADAGDVNGDGYDDILIGAHGDDDGGSGAGQTYLMLGKASGWTMDTDLSNADASFWGEDADDRSGCSVAGAGDINGDGYDDILIGASLNDEGGNHAGQTYMILGKATGWGMDTDLSNADASFWGEDANDCSGCSVAGAGDINGDGYDDMLIGAFQDDDGGSAAGQTYLILGKAAGWAMDTDLSSADASFWGEDADDVSGVSVTGAGDVNGDGYDDILIGACGDDDGGSAAGQTYMIFPTQNSPPTAISSVNAYSDDTYNTEISTCVRNDTIFIELRGTDGNPARKDMAFVNVSSNGSYPIGFSIRLMETGTNTGVYRSDVIIRNQTHDGYQWIKALAGETITISSVQDPSRNATIFVGPIILFPNDDDLTAKEDEEYFQEYLTYDWPEVDWTFETNASWLGWESVTHNISGVPDNGDVGYFWVRINISMNDELFDEHNFTITVTNLPPEIETDNVLDTWEDMLYLVDYNSTDDNHEVVKWHLETDAGGWLSIDSDTGILSGVPENEHVGVFNVDIGVHDGYGGWDWSRFTLTVHNTNDRPLLMGDDITESDEDSLYELRYEVSDIDAGDTDFEWELTTNAAWLEMEDENIIAGTPVNDDVGTYDVNVSVSDGNGGYDYREFMLIVHNTNDAPEWVDLPRLTNYTAGGKYRFDVNATDVDVGDKLTYSLVAEPPTNMLIDTETGVLQWITNEDDVDAYLFNLSVTDGEVTKYHDFRLEVLPQKQDPPPVAQWGVNLSAPAGVEMFAGDTRGVTVTVTNTGIVKDTFEMSLGTGNLAERVSFVGENKVTLDPQEAVNFKLWVDLSAKNLPAGDYPVTVTAVSEGAELVGEDVRAEVVFYVTFPSEPAPDGEDGGDGDGGGGDKEGETNMGLAIALGAVVVVIVVVLLLMVMRKKKAAPAIEDKPDPLSELPIQPPPVTGSPSIEETNTPTNDPPQYD